MRSPSVTARLCWLLSPLVLFIGCHRIAGYEPAHEAEEVADAAGDRRVIQGDGGTTSGDGPLDGASGLDSSASDSPNVDLGDVALIRDRSVYYDCGVSGVASVLFATSETYSGSLGGIAGADKRCALAADVANLSGNFVALISTKTDGVGARLSARIRYPVRNTKGLVIERCNLFDGLGLDGEILDEKGVALAEAESVWTGTTAWGYPAKEFSIPALGDCLGWARGTTSYRGGAGDPASRQSGLWLGSATDGNGPLCGDRKHLSCISVFP